MDTLANNHARARTRTHACPRDNRVGCGLSCLVIVLQITRIYLRQVVRQQQAEQVGRA
jgi:hypothetical protein